MIFPEALAIQSARARMAKRTPKELAQESKEFLAIFPFAGQDALDMYLLGLETARVIIAQRSLLIEQGMPAVDIL